MSLIRTMIAGATLGLALLVAPMAATTASAAPAASTADLMRSLQTDARSTIEVRHRRGWRHRHWRHRYCRPVRRCWHTYHGYRKCRWVRRCW